MLKKIRDIISLIFGAVGILGIPTAFIVAWMGHLGLAIVTIVVVLVCLFIFNLFTKSTIA